MKQRCPILRAACFFAAIFTAYGVVCAQPSNHPNPFLDMVGKSFAEYQHVYNLAVEDHISGGPASRMELVELLREAADIDESGEWEFNYRMMENNVRFYNSRDDGYVPSPDYTAEDHAENSLSLAAFAEERGLSTCRLRALFDVARICHIYLRDNERAFHYYLETAAEMETMSTQEFPLRPVIYRELAALYYLFREYDDAIVYFQKILDDPEACNTYHKPNYLAINGLGLCYRYGYEDYDRSDSCFMLILDQTAANEMELMVWEGIARGNIGYNHYLRGDMDTALFWLTAAMEKITRPNDFSYRSLCAVRIADIYLRKQQPEKAKKYLDKALDDHALTLVPEKGSDLYEVQFRYYATVGDERMAIAYQDSTMLAKNREGEEFSGLVLRRIEQQLRAVDERLHQQKMETETARSGFFMRTAIIVSCGLVVILALLVGIVVLYRRKRNAYKELVRKSQQWAQVGTGLPPGRGRSGVVGQPEADSSSKQDGESGRSPDIQDITIMRQLEELMKERKIYTDTNITLDTLAAELGYSRHYISRAVNRCARKNLFAYLNEYRVKEAIRIMSEKDTAMFSIDAIAMDSGFNDRKSFHRIFKQYTGLTPSAFRDNIGK